MTKDELTTLLAKALIKALTIALPWIFALIKVDKNKDE